MNFGMSSGMSRARCDQRQEDDLRKKRELTDVETAIAAAAPALIAGAVVKGAISRRKKTSAKPAKEIERKWVLAAPPPLDDKKSEEIRQGYILRGKVEMRVRRAEDSFFLTVKREAADGGRNEWETEIEEWVFDALWRTTKGRRLRKRRYTWKEGRQRLELDIYEGKLKGLIVLECEFRSAAAAKRFTLPDWAAGAREVTSDGAFRNETLARKGPKSIRKRLSGDATLSVRTKQESAATNSL